MPDRRMVNHDSSFKKPTAQIAVGVVVGAVLVAGTFLLLKSNDDTPTTASTTTAVSSSTTPASTTTSTPQPSQTSAPVPAPLGSGPGYDELGVAHVYKTDPDGGLLIKPTASTAGMSVGVATPNAAGLFPTGQVGVYNGHDWYEVNAPDIGVSGWVSSIYTVPLPSFAAFPCDPDLTHYGFDAASVPQPDDPAAVPGGLVADHIYALNHMSSADCERTVITFGHDPTGSGFGFGVMDQGVPADNLPAGGIFDSIEAGFPGLWTVHLTSALTVPASTATELYGSDNGVVDAFVVRDTFTGPEIAVDLKYAQNRAARVYWVADPLRLVIDTVPAPTGTGMDIAAVMGPSMADPTMLIALEHPINWDLNGVTMAPVTVRGWGRPFESDAGLTIRQSPGGGAPGSGALASAGVSYVDWSGTTTLPVGAVNFALPTTEYAEMWGRFEFTIDSIAPGSYELGIDDFDDVFHHQFTIGGTTGASTTCSGGMPIPATALNDATTTGDFDGDGAMDTLHIYEDGGAWYAHLVLSNGYGTRIALDPTIHAEDPNAPAGLFWIEPVATDLDLDGRAEGWARDTFDWNPPWGRMSTTYVFFESDCGLHPVTLHMGGPSPASWYSDNNAQPLCFLPGGGTVSGSQFDGGFVTGDWTQDTFYSYVLDVDASLGVAEWYDGIVMDSAGFTSLGC